MDRKPGDRRPKRSLEQDEQPRKKSRTTRDDEAAQIGEVLRRLALEELGLSSIPPGAMVVPADILDSLSSMIQHARGATNEAKALPHLAEGFAQQASEHAQQIQHAVATIIDNASSVASTCNQRSDGGHFQETPKLSVVDKAESLVEEVCRHFTDARDDLNDDPDMLDDAISHTQSLVDRLHEIKRCQEERRKAQEERKRVERVLSWKVRALQDLVAEAAYAYDNLGEERNRLLVDMYDMGVQTEYVVSQAEIAGRVADKILELVRSPDAPPAVVVLEQLVESIIQELRLRLHLGPADHTNEDEGGGYGGSAGGYGEWSKPG